MSDTPTCVGCGKPMLPGEKYRCYPDGRTGYHRPCEDAVNAQLLAQAQLGPVPASRPGAWNVFDIRVVDRESPEGQQELARRAAAQRREPTAAERALAEAFGRRADGGE